MAVLDRLRKLLALAKSDNPHEAALAAELAQKLMVAHHLDEFMLEAAERPPEEPISDQGAIDPERVGESRRIPAWEVNLAGAVARSVDCRVYYVPGARISVVGRQSDAQVVRYLFLYLSRVINRLADEFWEREGDRDQGARRWKHAFRLGCVEAIRRRLSQGYVSAIQEATKGDESKAIQLVRRGEAVEEWMHRTMRLGSGRTTTYSSRSGHEVGERAGASIDLGGARKGALTTGLKRLTGRTS